MAMAALMSSAICQRNDRVMNFSASVRQAASLSRYSEYYALQSQRQAGGLSGSSPTQLNQRHSLTRQRKTQFNLTVFAANPLRRSQQLKLSGGFEPRVLLRSRILRRPHLFPHHVSVTVVAVNLVALDQNALRR